MPKKFPAIASHFEIWDCFASHPSLYSPMTWNYRNSIRYITITKLLTAKSNLSTWLRDKSDEPLKLKQIRPYTEHLIIKECIGWAVRLKAFNAHIDKKVLRVICMSVEIALNKSVLSTNEVRGDMLILQMMVFIQQGVICYGELYKEPCTSQGSGEKPHVDGKYCFLNVPWWWHTWKRFPFYWPFVRGIHQSLVDPLTKDQYRKSLMLSFLLAGSGCKLLNKQSTCWWFGTTHDAHCLRNVKRDSMTIFLS